MDDFSIKPGAPNMYGLVGGEANAIMPNKRMLSSMTPTIILKEGKPFAVIGTPGGSTIITSVFQTVLNLIDFKLSTDQAVNQPKFHHQWLPDVVYIEKTFPDALRKQLEAMGYKFEVRASIGRTEVIKVNANGRIEASADKRGDDSLAGY
jgi:gamma-glutamyltranspeptidase/glutathione hydrolase